MMETTQTTDISEDVENSSAEVDSSGTVEAPQVASSETVTTGTESSSAQAGSESQGKDSEGSSRRRFPKGSIPPSLSLDEAITIISRFYEQAGGEASIDALSMITNNTVNSSVFVKKNASLKNYGLIFEENKQIRLTDLGYSITAPRQISERQVALKDAFLKIDNFAKIYEKYRGRILPQDEFLINTFRSFVPKDLAPEWLDKFKRSASIAGLLATRPDGKLQVRESVWVPEDEKEETASPEPKEEAQAPSPVAQVVTPQSAPPPTPKSATPYEVLIQILSPEMEEQEQEAVWVLIRYLKKKEAAQ